MKLNERNSKRLLSLRLKQQIPLSAFTLPILRFFCMIIAGIEQREICISNDIKYV